jgi:hypothetical protein
MAGLDPAIHDSAQRKELNFGKGLASTHCNDVLLIIDR